MRKQKVFIPNFVPQLVVDYLARHFDVLYRHDEIPPSNVELEEGIAEAEGLLCYSRIRIHKELLDCAPKLCAVSNIAVGYDNFDVQEMTRRGIVGTNTPEVLTETTADFAFALLMAAARRIAEADAYVKEGKWESWTPNLLLGHDIYGATLGIVGMGKIGLAVARRARGFSMRTLYFNRGRNLEAEHTLGVSFAQTLENLLLQSDFVLILTPLTESTTHLIGEREFALMKQSAILINVARGPVVDEGALIQALRERTIAGAAVDVYDREPIDKENPLLQFPTVVTTPHIGSATGETRQKMAMLAAENLTAALTGIYPPNIVNPEVWSQRMGK